MTSLRTIGLHSIASHKQTGKTGCGEGMFVHQHLPFQHHDNTESPLQIRSLTFQTQFM